MGVILRYIRNTFGVAFRRVVISTAATQLAMSTSPTITSGAGAPTASEPKGSVYLRTNGASGAQVVYMATDSVGTWVALANTTAAVAIQSAGGQSYIIDALLSATGEAIVKLADNLAIAWEFKEAANSYIKIATTDAAELITFGKNVVAGAALTVTGGLTVSSTLTRTPGASTAAAGTTTADATALPSGTSSVYPTTAADDTKGVRVAASDKVTGRSFFVGNGVSNKILKVYPPSGGTINGAAADVAFSTVSGKGCWMHCLDATANTWLAC